ncbi:MULTISPECIES: GNAT family N-acetyltransferase [unclassified Vibrio]|uniref:GNAT family N-acetyltransferase n=1 Tax=unclassified Vibrio TaxID=2614977 RepID=UPI000B8E8A35|nr:MULTISPECIES: GNAT family N-acetyltransferase [unclassified Vibrio]NAX42863.1 GNAT family N-acetyltransferase [Vibrio sp. V25_P4S6T154]OXX40835.1 GNAT family N-acetyltransferase [Vibrio sp. V17_P4S1T151]OXX63061.1 GNAT family N-acetyltransferase [Vibrio sp. V15_P4S5T153]OXX67096.1 GNAT family N-acetyltransferase [Vibrio sp. V20_P4S3T152]
MRVTFRPASDSDYQFAFDLKKVAEMDGITAIFGWDEELQQVLHRQEWHSGLPTIICADGQPIGTYLLQSKHETLYFSRFFILPDFQNRGVGSQVLQLVVNQANLTQYPCKLCYLQGSPVGALYQRFGFTHYQMDDEFSHMHFIPTPKGQ